MTTVTTADAQEDIPIPIQGIHQTAHRTGLAGVGRILLFGRDSLMEDGLVCHYDWRKPASNQGFHLNSSVNVPPAVASPLGCVVG